MTRPRLADVLFVAVAWAGTVVLWVEPWSARVRWHVLAVLMAYVLVDLGRRWGRP